MFLPGFLLDTREAEQLTITSSNKSAIFSKKKRQSKTYKFYTKVMI